MSLALAHLSRRFDACAALDDVSLNIAPGEFLALLGPSGSGKTTLLRILAGLDYPNSGSITQNGENLLAIPAYKRRVGLVFQHYALFQHMSVRENVAFGLRVRPRRQRPSRREIAERVDLLLERVQLNGLGKRYPAQLSGGQRQRVALARALAVEPSLLLLDEPFGALDAQVRVALRRWLRELHAELGLTSIFVTHDQEEALALADRVAIMQHGRVEQVGTPEAVYREPATPFVCEFIGRSNRIALVRDGGHWTTRGWTLPDPWTGRHAQAVAYVRPEQLALGGEGNWSASVRHVHRAGGTAHLALHVPALGQELDADVSISELTRLNLRLGDAVQVQPRGAVMFANVDAHGTPATRHVWHAPTDIGPLTREWQA